MCACSVLETNPAERLNLSGAVNRPEFCQHDSLVDSRVFEEGPVSCLPQGFAAMLQRISVTLAKWPIFFRSKRDQ